MNARLHLIAYASLALILGLGGCGGGGGGGDTTLVEGSVIKGPVLGANVTIFSVNADGSKGFALGTAITDANGKYAVRIARQNGPIMVEATNGTYDDEATAGVDVTPLTTTLRSASADASMANVSMNATPLTETMVRRALAAPGAINAANLASTQTAVVADAALPAGTDIVRTLPVVTPGTTDPYGLAIVNFAKLAVTAGGVAKALEGYSTPGPLPRAVVSLGAAGTFAILSKAGVTDTGTTSIVGDVGTSPITGAAVGLTCPEVTGKILVVDAAGPAPCAIKDDTALTAAVGAMETAYTDAAGRTLPDFTELGAGEIGGKTLTPGLYKWGTGVSISTDVTLSGGADAVWIFQVAGKLNVANGKRVTLTGGAQAKNIFWVVGDDVTIGTTAHFAGVVLGKKLIALNTGATATGRMLAQTAVTLQSSAITQPAK